MYFQNVRNSESDLLDLFLNNQLKILTFIFLAVSFCVFALIALKCSSSNLTQTFTFFSIQATATDPCPNVF